MQFAVDVAVRKLNKYGEYLCGDSTEIMKTPDSDVIILADGMGSGVRASILSTLTVKILGTMFAGGASLKECVETMAHTLPADKTRGMAYSTFTIVQIFSNGEVYLVNYDNPGTIYIRDGDTTEPPFRHVYLAGHDIRECRFRLKIGDALVMMSDGVVHAGVGSGAYPFGWPAEEAARFAAELYEKNPSPVRLASAMVGYCRELYGGRPMDDTTVAAVRIIGARVVHLMTGPPGNPEDDRRIIAEFMGGDADCRVIAGGTSATIAARETGKTLQVSMEYLDPDIPPAAEMEGVDLVTEGILTLRRCVEIMEAYVEACMGGGTGRDGAYPGAMDAGDYPEKHENAERNEAEVLKELDKKNAASRLARILLEECTDLRMFVGTAVNSAYQNPDLPIDLGIRQILVKRLIRVTRSAGKRVTVTYF